MDAYLAYLIRLWRVETEHGPNWRAALEDPHSAEQWHFADLNGLFAFLVTKTGAAMDAPPHSTSLKEEENSHE